MINNLVWMIGILNLNLNLFISYKLSENKVYCFSFTTLIFKKVLKSSSNCLNLCVIGSVKCGGQIDLPHPNSNEIKWLASPNYPNDYPASVQCVWNLLGPGYKDFELQFNDFDIKTGDTVQVRGGFSNGLYSWKTTNGLKVLSGNLSSLNQTSFRFLERGRVEFVSDDSLQGKGFQAIVNYGIQILYLDRCPRAS